jgi:Uma2 family endonuclease
MQRSANAADALQRATFARSPTMASPPQVRKTLTLEDFLQLPEQKPVLEYLGGRVRAKAVPQFRHSRLTLKIADHLNRFAEPTGLGEAFPEIRCTFAGRSIVPDVVFLVDEHIAYDADGVLVNEIRLPPDIHVEIISPDQSVRVSDEKLTHATAHGCPLGWLIHPEKKTVDVYRPGLPAERLPDQGVLTGEPVLPGYRLSVAELFGWLRRRPERNEHPEPGADPV